MDKQKGRSSTGVLLLIFVAGFLIMSYPFVSNWLATRRGIEEVDHYDSLTKTMSPETLAEEWEKAEVYNEHLRGDPVEDPFVAGSGKALPGNYQDVLNLDMIMCYVEIPEINVKLPVYHGVSEEVLEKGVGHIESTALPIGGMGAHTVLTGHTGLPKAKLFTDLIELETGDLFYIHVLGKTLVYEVDQIKVIDPEDLSDLTAYDDKDYITLLTCTPYGVNSHRLLVRGERIYSFTKQITIFRSWMIYKVLFCVIGILILLICGYLCRLNRRIKEEKLVIKGEADEKKIY